MTNDDIYDHDISMTVINDDIIYNHNDDYQFNDSSDVCCSITDSFSESYDNIIIVS